MTQNVLTKAKENAPTPACTFVFQKCVVEGYADLHSFPSLTRGDGGLV